MQDMLLLPVAPWLLCIWQARQAGATWWSVLITILCVQLSKMLLERVTSDVDDHNEKSGWPELLRASIGITLTVYVVQHVIWDFTSSHCITNIGIILLVLACVMNYDFPFPWRVHVLISLMAIFAVILRECGPPSTTHQKFDFATWLQFILSIHAMLVSHTVSEHPISPYARIACTLSVSFFASMQYHKTAFILMVLPSIFFREKNAVAVCIMPVLNAFCNSDLYPLQDPQNKTEARRVLLIQQKQEILFYIMAWCVTLGLWAHVRPSVLFWLQVVGGLLYLASLRRYSNVVKIFNYSSTNRRRHQILKKNEEPEIPKRKLPVDHTTSTSDLLLSRMMLMQQQSKQLVLTSKPNFNKPSNS